MQSNDYELISAYLDDELDEQTRSDVENRLANDSEFAEVFAVFDNQDAQIKSAFADIDNKPVPEELQALLFSKPQAETEPHTQTTVVRPPVSMWKKWMPLAASVAVAVVLTPLVFQQIMPGNTTVADVLDTQASGETVSLNDNQKVFVSMSFDNANGDWCREYFIASGSSQQHKVACLIQDKWEDVIEVDAPFPDANAYMPSSGGSAQIEAWLDDNMATDSLSPKQERDRLKN